MNSAFNKLGAWFLTETGKSFVFGSAVTAVGGIACLHMLPHTFFLEQYKDVVHLYKNGFAVSVTAPLADRFKRTLDLLEIPQTDRKQFRPFMVYGFDVFSAGTFFSRFGVVVGLPTNFTYIDDDVIDKVGIRVNENSVPWEMEEGQLLLQSLTLSEKAQMYAMAREVQMRKTPKYFIDMFSSVAFFIAAYGAGNHLNTKFNFYARPRALRFTLYGLLGLFGFLNYVLVKDVSQLHYEKQVDEDLVSRSEVFREGGREFYAKTLSRNVALRGLMGSLGESKYTALGNENYLIRQRHLPLVQRRDYFESNVVNA